MIKDTALFMFGIQGKQLNDNEIRWLNHPLTAGVILFTRNYDNPAQIRALVHHIRSVADNDILLAVDHEGGRVQRFREGFTRIPAMAELGKRYDDKPELGLSLAWDCGYVMAYEIADCGIDFSFAPVLDVQTDFSAIIGDRGFHSNPEYIGDIAQAFYEGMRAAGTIGVGKHFPGHGNVVADSHLELPVSHSELATLWKTDLPPFKSLIDAGIEAIMPAHILYDKVDELPAGFSAVWLADILRRELQFDGCIISDDLDMAGAAAYGEMPQRVALASEHCDLILLCNNHEQMHQAFEIQQVISDKKRQLRLNALQYRPTERDSDKYLNALQRLQSAVLV